MASDYGINLRFGTEQKNIIALYTRSSPSDFAQILNIYNLEISYENPSFIDFCKMNNISTCGSNGMGGGGPEAYFLVIHTREFYVLISLETPLLQAKKLSLGHPPPAPHKIVIQIQYQLMDVTCNG